MPPQCVQPIFVTQTNKVMEQMKDVSWSDKIQENVRDCEEPQGCLTPNDSDVLCGRGGNVNLHPGNCKFRNLVESNKRVYLTARFKREKRLIAENIITEIKRQNPPGRFLLKKGGDSWYEIPEEKARDKTSQALREGAPKLREAMKSELEAQRQNNFDSPKPNDAYNSGCDARQNHYDHEGHDHYGNNPGYGSPKPRPDSQFSYNNIMDTMSSTFGCGNYRDVRDDDRMRNEYSPQGQNHEYKDSYYLPDDAHYQEYRRSRRNNNSRVDDMRHYGHQGWDQRGYAEYPPQNEARRHDTRDQGHYHPDSYHDKPRPQMNDGHYMKNERHMYNYHERSESPVDSLGVYEDDNRKRLRTTSPIGSMMNMDIEADMDVRTPPPEDNQQTQSGWDFAFCQSSLTDIFSWTVNGDEPASNIKKINSIEMDEPVSPSEMKGSSLVNVFNDSVTSLIEPLPVQELSENKDPSMMSLNDSTLNLLDNPSLDMKFST